MILGEVAQHPNMAIASAVAVVSVIAEAVIDAPIASWENIGTKGLLVAAVVFLARALARQRDEDKAAAAKREDLLRDTLDRVHNSLGALKSSVDVQTGYYKTVAQTLISREVKPDLP